MDKPSWHFLKSGSGIVAADNLANPLRDTQLNDYEILIREAFQNSYDERINDDAFTFRIKKHSIDQALSKNFLEMFCFDEILEKSKHFDDPNNYISNGIRQLTDCMQNYKGFSVLEVSDFNSSGLGGRWNRGRNIEDKFYNLVLSINRSRKQDNKDGKRFLGSYGVGKMVFALSSEIRSILYYSKFKPSDATNGEHTRLMMTSFLPLIDDQKEDIEYSGHAYFGKSSDETNNPRKPLANDEADKFISDLGFKSRQENEYGTSVYLPMCDFDISNLKNAFEKWWWPALMDNSKILIELEDELGNIVTPNHLNNTFSKPFVDLYNKEKELVSIRHEHKKKDIASIKLDKYNDNFDTNVTNQLACIRGGLVIEYKQPFKEGNEDCYGIVKINEDFEEIFTFSEPEAHDTWNSNHKRLLSRYGISGKKLVEQGLNLINQKCSDFQLSLNSVEKNKNYSGTKFLDARLSQIFKSPKKGKPISPPSSSRLPYIHKSSKRNFVDGKAIDHLYFSIGLNDSLDVDNIDYELKITLISVVDTNNSKGELIPIRINMSNDQDTIINATNSLINFSLNNNKVIKGEAYGQVFSKWTTKWAIELNPVDL